jgi:hypothetical protein
MLLDNGGPEKLIIFNRMFLNVFTYGLRMLEDGNLDVVVGDGNLDVIRDGTDLLEGDVVVAGIGDDVAWGFE